MSAKSFGQILTELRERACMSKAQFARRIGVGADQVGRYESGEIENPGLEILKKMAAALCVSVDELVGASQSADRSGISHRQREVMAELSDAEAMPQIGGDIYNLILAEIKKVKSVYPTLDASRFRDGETDAWRREKLVVPQYDPVIVDRRDEIAPYEIERRGTATGAIPHWYDLACGEGSELERCEDYIYYRELPDWKGRHSMKIKGESMMNTLQPGDFVIVREILGPSGLTLSSIENPDDGISLIRFQSFVRHDDICVVGINGDAPTLKRVMIRKRPGVRWSLSIRADNPLAARNFGSGGIYDISRDESVCFYATLIGRAKREGE